MNIKIKKEKTAAKRINAAFPLSTSYFIKNEGFFQNVEISQKAETPCITIGFCHVYRDALPLNSLFRGDLND